MSGPDRLDPDGPGHQRPRTARPHRHHQHHQHHHITAAPGTAPVTVEEIAELLRHLTDLGVSGRSADPAARTVFLHRKAELSTRLAADPATPTSPPTPARRTP